MLLVIVSIKGCHHVAKLFHLNVFNCQLFRKPKMWNSSYRFTPRTMPYIYDTIPALMSKWAEEQGEKEAVVIYYPDNSRHSISFHEIYEKAEKVAAYLVHHGIKEGDIVTIAIPNRVSWIVCMVGTLMARAVVISTDMADLVHSVNETKSRILFLYAGSDESEMSNVDEVINRSLPEIPSIELVLLTESKQHSIMKSHPMIELLDTIVANDPMNVPLPTTDPDDTAILFRTSGSTGLPKLIAYSHFHCMNQIAHGSWEGEVYFNDRPFAWVLGVPYATFVYGATEVSIDTKETVSNMNISNVCEILSKEACTGALFMCYLLHDLNDATDDMISKMKLKTILTTGQRITTKDVQTIERMKCKAVILYGSTELGSTTSMILPTPDGQYKYTDGLCGDTLPGVETKITSEGCLLPDGVIGEVFQRRSMINKRHFVDGEYCDFSLDKGWMKTGDIGYMSEEGLVIVARSTDTIKRGSRLIYPLEVEKQILRCPDVKSVAVIDVPDDRLYNEICACVVLHEYVDGTHQQLKDKLDALFNKTAVDGLGIKPKYYFVIDDLPVSKNGKPDRKRLSQLVSSMIEEKLETNNRQ